MAGSLSFRLLTPAGSEVEAVVEQVTLPGAGGEFGVLPEHTTYLAALVGGIVSYSAAGQVRRLAVRGGVVEVGDNTVTLLAEEVFRSQDVSLSELDAREEGLLQGMENASDDDAEYARLQGEVSFLSVLRTLASGS